MLTLVVSDLHLGSPHCQPERILTFLNRIPDGSRLILNGDILDRHPETLPASHQVVLGALILAGERLELVSLAGNHDDLAKSASPPWAMLAEFTIDDQLHISHGHRFRLFRSYEARFLPLIRFILKVAMFLGAPTMHPAAYAKRWPWLYQILRRRLRDKAIRHARSHGYAAITCGHIHFAEDYSEDGIRYLNSGCWTEANTHCLSIKDGEIRLIENPDRVGFV